MNTLIVIFDRFNLGMSFIKFIFSKYFFINIAIYLVLIAIALWGVFYGIDKYTLHNQTITMPNLNGFHSTELENFTNDNSLQFVIIDSVYEIGAPKGSVIDQNPKSGVQVKKGRKVYLTINANSPKKIQFPDLQDVTLRQASAVLETFGIKVDSLKYRPDQCVKCVLEVMMDTAKIKPGTMIPVGSSVVLVLGSGLSNEYINVPILINLPLVEAEKKLKDLGLNLGAYNYEDCESAEDTAKAKIFRQFPAHDNEELIQLGQSVLLFLTADSSRIPEIIIDSTAVQL